MNQLRKRRSARSDPEKTTFHRHRHLDTREVGRDLWRDNIRPPKPEATNLVKYVKMRRTFHPLRCVAGLASVVRWPLSPRRAAPAATHARVECGRPAATAIPQTTHQISRRWGEKKKTQKNINTNGAELLASWFGLGLIINLTHAAQNSWLVGTHLYDVHMRLQSTYTVVVVSAWCFTDLRSGNVWYVTQLWCGMETNSIQ